MGSWTQCLCTFCLLWSTFQCSIFLHFLSIFGYSLGPSKVIFFFVLVMFLIWILPLLCVIKVVYRDDDTTTLSPNSSEISWQPLYDCIQYSILPSAKLTSQDLTLNWLDHFAHLTPKNTFDPSFSYLIFSCFFIGFFPGPSLSSKSLNIRHVPQTRVCNFLFLYLHI